MELRHLHGLLGVARFFGFILLEICLVQNCHQAANQIDEEFALGQQIINEGGFGVRLAATSALVKRLDQVFLHGRVDLEILGLAKEICELKEEVLVIGCHIGLGDQVGILR